MIQENYSCRLRSARLAINSMVLYVFLLNVMAICKVQTSQPVPQYLSDFLPRHYIRSSAMLHQCSVRQTHAVAYSLLPLAASIGMLV
jgi:hypothetical protein